ncbi:hypothetical protein A1O3_01998 [Capronia epimyces CBS 606.96]|uniref:Uncharacterized protein n=1 Tax=Capronia epimyces CBS 606.96 TaxID=1182542 RepID=W9Z362_9EURO|nr:uncharacterized protein A1O3_01998 [Capronia epimyces CBS 606.96]EXJ88934.1 hypothetical protein A1O3_01998 [Capronia epimyces CBS 606.96]
MARIATFLAYLHTLLIQVPQNGYYNISRLVQPQIRSIAESLTANTTNSGRGVGIGVGKEIEMQPMKPNKLDGMKHDSTTTASRRVRQS